MDGFTASPHDPTAPAKRGFCFDSTSHEGLRRWPYPADRRDNARMETVRIATRKSPLALWQSEHVADRLRQAYPGLHVELVPMSTRGDEVLDRSLAAIGGKGLFLKELELAMLRGDADCAVHSLKDVPMELDAPFALPAMLTRHDPADGFISNLYASLDALPIGARVGTSSLRRQAQLRALRPDLQLLDLRGAWPSSTTVATTPSCWPWPGWNGWAWAIASWPACSRRSGCRRRHRARWRWSVMVATRG